MRIDRRNLLNLGALALAGGGVPVWAQAAAPVRRAVEVADTIEMTALIDPPAAETGLNPQAVKIAPDGSAFLLVTSKGNLATGANDCELLIYEMEQVRRSLDGGGRPRSVSLARFSSASNRPAIARATWLSDSRSIAFLGENPGEAAQVHIVSRDRAARRLTSHPTAIIDFDLRDENSPFIYAALAPVDWSGRKAHGYVVGAESLVDVLGKGETQLCPRVAYFIGAAEQPPRAIALPSYVLQVAHYPWGVWLSPDSRWAVAPQLVPKVAAPWRGTGPFAADDGSVLPDFHGDSPFRYLQDMLVDMNTGEAAPVLDAPGGLFIGGSGVAAQWLPDSSAVILANSFLPVVGVDAEERARRLATPAIVEVAIPSRKPIRITDLLGTPQAAQRGQVDQIRLDGSGRLEVSWTRQQTPTVYERDATGWSEVTAVSKSSALTINLAQSVNLPPEIHAVRAGASSVIATFNPQFAGLDMGRIETLKWKDADGAEHIGGILKPVGWRPGKRYPLVIQTHGYREDTFLMSGPYDSGAGFAIRALAGRGFVVAQVNELRGPGFGSRRELEGEVAGYAALIDQLDRDGLIDRARVGLHGWSRTGFYVQHAITFSDLKLAAASVSDASELSAYAYPEFYGVRSGMQEYESLIGGELWGDANSRLWAERDPSFHLDRVHTPLRIEAYEFGLSWWDVFANLRRHKRPVEYVSLPLAEHQPVKPWEIQTSREGVVDWYDFWLNGHEDPNPRKIDQYQRWRELRGWHETDIVSGQAPVAGG